MTPEEILAECPELERRHLGGDCYYYIVKDSKNFIDDSFALLFAKTRKEARELREQNKHLQGQLNYFTGGPVDG